MTSDKELKETIKMVRLKDLDKMMRNLRCKGREPYLKGRKGRVKLEFE